MNNSVIGPVVKSQEFKNLIETVKSPKSVIGIFGSFGGFNSVIYSLLSQETGKKVCVITLNEVEAKNCTENLQRLGKNVVYYPGRDIVFFDSYYHSHQLENNRILGIDKMAKGDFDVVVTSVDGILEKILPVNHYLDNRMNIKVAEDINLEDFLEFLQTTGYSREEIVETKGSYSLRGGILDVYSPNYDYPVRIELFDEEIDSIRSFDPETQKSIEKMDMIEIISAKEVFIPEAKRKEFLEKLVKQLESFKSSINEEKINSIQNLIDYFQGGGKYIDGVDKYINLIEENLGCILDFFTNEDLIVFQDSNRIIEKFKNGRENYIEGFKNLMELGKVLPVQSQIIFEYNKLLAKAHSKKIILVNNLKKNLDFFKVEELVNFTLREANIYHGKTKDLIEDVKRLSQKNYTISIVSSKEDRAIRIKDQMVEEGISCTMVDESSNLTEGSVNILIGDIAGGFELNSIKYLLISEKEILGSNKKYLKKKKRSGRKILSFNELSLGDFIVHENHGIGKYIGIEQLKIDNTRKDFLKLQYAGEDFLYIPIEQMNLIQKYVGGEVRTKRLNKLGSQEWKKAKAKVKKAIEDMTDELLELYAKRRMVNGYAFSEDSIWQKQFEDMFPYEETPDQLKSIDDIKKDMESPQPMDRLLCGDVGYGKTEVAIRGIFKAVMDSKQVAVLVPTTILAQQHYNNIKSRFSKFPVNVEMLSRFRTKKQQDKIIDDVKSGVVDVVIGTHRILSKDINYKNLGLLVVDEEQRFGVKHKEMLKQLKSNVDVLTLTATPIPRTLHMSLIGVRDMSVIEDPPEDRFPVQTYVVEHDDSIVGDAILKEVNRGGQVFYVYNKVKDIDVVAGKIANMFPDVRVAYAHGQMSEVKLEKIMMDFLNHQFDVLVCTTIIETGLDIPNVNTIIITDSDKMGLSQLYQLRGRVGRSNRIAYSYLTYKRDKVLSEISEKRLKAIKDFTELGAGFKIAMRDLEIRGSGNILGAEQHGHMDAIGYDLYCKMLEETVGRIKGKEIIENIETSIELSANAFISDRYIPDGKQKLEMYKRISAVETKEDYYNLEEEIEDRFGTIPSSVYNLLSISYIKSMAEYIRIKNISENKTNIIFEIFDFKYIKPEVINEMTLKYGRNIKINLSSTPYIELRKGKTPESKKIKYVEDFLEAFVAVIKK
jgi:transcription-repair coupling factor (superfamily II helicase)